MSECIGESQASFLMSSLHIPDHHQLTSITRIMDIKDLPRMVSRRKICGIECGPKAIASLRLSPRPFHHNLAEIFFLSMFLGR